MSYTFLVIQMTMTITLLATACFLCAQVKVEHPVKHKRPKRKIKIYIFPGYVCLCTIVNPPMAH